MEIKSCKNPIWNFAMVLTLLGVVVLVIPTRTEAQNFSPFSDFQAMSLDQLKTLQVKLTYVGVQTRPTPSRAFTSPFHTFDPDAFVPFRRSGISYSNDDIQIRTFTASPGELKAVIDNVAMLPNVTAGGVATNIYLSFALLNTSGGTKAFEAVLNKADTSDLFAQLRLALQSNKEGLKELSGMACPLDLLEPARPVDVTTNVTVALGGVRLNRTTQRFVGTVTAKNNSVQGIAGPVSVVFDLSGNVRLVNADGTTCGTSPVGRGFINLPLTGNALPPSGSAQANLEFENPDLEPIKATTKVLAGPGAR